MTASIISLDAEGSFLIPEIGFREESDFTVCHKGKERESRNYSMGRLAGAPPRLADTLAIVGVMTAISGKWNTVANSSVLR